MVPDSLCNLYSDQPKFSYDAGSNDSAIFSYLSVCIFLLVLCTALSLISSCVYSPLPESMENTSAAHCPLCWPISQKHSIGQWTAGGLGEGKGVGTAGRQHRGTSNTSQGDLLVKITHWLPKNPHNIWIAAEFSSAKQRWTKGSHGLKDEIKFQSPACGYTYK